MCAAQVKLAVRDRQLEPGRELGRHSQRIPQGAGRLGQINVHRAVAADVRLVGRQCGSSEPRHVHAGADGGAGSFNLSDHFLHLD